MAIVIFDIDGTLAKKGDSYTDLVNLKPKEQIVRIAKAMAKAGGSKVAIVTARPENSREDTERWVKKHGLKPEFLLMRKDGDFRPDYDVRVDQVKEAIKRLKYGGNVMLYDDKISNCKAVEKALGVTCIHVQN